MTINTNDVAQKMIDAAKSVVGDKWPATQIYFESESKIFAERFASIAALLAEGAISQTRAQSHVEFQKEAWETVLLAVEGLNQIMVEQALNAALNAVSEVVNTAVGFALL
jgi:Asp-tRNA(Asn)/Glu-tRNA(Gln) amidotransferase B subunit